MRVIVPLASGFEEIEAVTIIDVLRRAKIQVTTAYLDSTPVTGAHDISVAAETNISKISATGFDAILLPGGMPGSKNLKENKTVISLVQEMNSLNKLMGAICAAPIVFGHAGVLNGREATCFPEFESELKGAIWVDSPVVVDGNVITGKGPGCAMAFALEFVGISKGNTLKESLKNSMQIYWKL